MHWIKIRWEKKKNFSNLLVRVRIIYFFFFEKKKKKKTLVTCWDIDYVMSRFYYVIRYSIVFVLTLIQLLVIKNNTHNSTPSLLISPTAISNPLKWLLLVYLKIGWSAFVLESGLFPSISVYIVLNMENQIENLIRLCLFLFISSTWVL